MVTPLKEKGGSIEAGYEYCDSFPRKREDGRVPPGSG